MLETGTETHSQALGQTPAIQLTKGKKDCMRVESHGHHKNSITRKPTETTKLCSQELSDSGQTGSLYETGLRPLHMCDSCVTWSVYLWGSSLSHFKYSIVSKVKHLILPSFLIMLYFYNLYFKIIYFSLDSIADLEINNL